MGRLIKHTTTIKMSVCGVTGEFNLIVSYRKTPYYPPEIEAGGVVISQAELENAEIVTVILELSPGCEIGFYSYLSDEQIAAIVEEILE